MVLKDECNWHPAFISSLVCVLYRIHLWNWSLRHSALVSMSKGQCHEGQEAHFPSTFLSQCVWHTCFLCSFDFQIQALIDYAMRVFRASIFKSPYSPCILFLFNVDCPLRFFKYFLPISPNNLKPNNLKVIFRAFAECFLVMVDFARRNIWPLSSDGHLSLFEIDLLWSPQSAPKQGRHISHWPVSDYNVDLPTWRLNDDPGIKICYLALFYIVSW